MMKKLTMIQTHDGALHLDVSDAKRHLDRAYADLLCSVTQQIRGKSYKDATEWISNNLVRFKYLIEIKADMNMIDDEQGAE
jgi:hypothetical protein